MSPQRLALRTLMLGRPRSVLTVLLIAACLCLLDLFAGSIASVRARLEYQAVTGERLGHLTITHADPAGGAEDSAAGGSSGGSAGGSAFKPAEAAQVKRLVEAMAGVALVVPQMNVEGIASTGQRSALFHGEGIGSAGLEAVPPAHGKLKPDQPNGIALSSGHARSLGLKSGSNVTLTGVSVDKPVAPLKAEVVDVYSSTDFSGGGRSLLMPFELAQTLVDTERTERLVVYLADPRQLDAMRLALRSALRTAGLAVHVHTWQELSPSYLKGRGDSDLNFESVAGMVFAVIAAAIAATISMNALERRREVATLRALGMHSSGVFLMYAAEALWMAAFAVIISVVGSGLIAWVVNRAALSYTTQQALKRAPMLVELDFNRMGMAVVTVMAVALLASLAPAFKAARAEVAEGLAG
jgi:putative ABC transport system permease protein